MPFEEPAWGYNRLLIFVSGDLLLTTKTLVAMTKDDFELLQRTKIITMT